ncbi:MAG: dihydroxyacetone kinase transcriptional activator DhaS [Oscillospiraceae bacterium]|jgi:probable dihydroxyacetone kinase regulator|nr:dihydroxyacetone kinase transcriptional activator DhaS [Oscillospiraceae bacterium]
MPESFITKKAIAVALKELMKHKSFDKITVADITKQCGLNRQTFYYHFQDKYELVNWIYYNEAIVILTTDLSFDNWSDRILDMLQVMKKESYFYENALRSSGDSEFERYLLSFSKELFVSIIHKLDEGYNIQNDDIEFIAQFYSFGIVGMIVSWAKNGMAASPESMTSHLKNLVYDSKMFAVKRYMDKNDS